MVRLVGATGILFVVTCASLPAKEVGSVDADAKLYDRSKIGPLADGRVIVPTNQVLSPAGRQVVVGGRPTDVALSPDGRWLAVQNFREAQLLDLKSGDIVSRAGIKGASFKGIAS